MGRNSVETILEQNPDRWFTYDELSKMANICKPAVCQTVRRNSGVYIEVKRVPGQYKILVKYKKQGDDRGKI